MTCIVDKKCIGCVSLLVILRLVIGFNSYLKVFMKQGTVNVREACPSVNIKRCWFVLILQANT